MERVQSGEIIQRDELGEKNWNRKNCKNNLTVKLYLLVK